MRTITLTLCLTALVLCGCPGTEGDAVVVAPPPTPSAATPEPVAAVPTTAPDEPSDPEAVADVPATLPGDPVDPVDARPDPPEPKPDRKPINLLDLSGDGIGIDEIDVNVGTARVKDRPSTHSGDVPEAPPTAATAGRKAVERTISHGEQVDFRKFLKRGKATVVEFYADW